MTDRHDEYDRKAAELGNRAWAARMAVKAAEQALGVILDEMVKLRIEYLEGKDMKQKCPPGCYAPYHHLNICPNWEG